MCIISMIYNKMANSYHIWRYPDVELDLGAERPGFVTQTVQHISPEGENYGTNHVTLYKGMLVISSHYHSEREVTKVQDIGNMEQAVDIIMMNGGRNGYYRLPGDNGILHFAQPTVAVANFTNTLPHHLVMQDDADLYIHHAAITHSSLKALAELYPEQMERFVRLVENLDYDTILDGLRTEGTPFQQNCLAAIYAPHALGNSAESFVVDNLVQYIGAMFPPETKSKSLQKVPYTHELRQKIQMAREIIAGHISAPLSLRELALAVGTNEHYLKAGFKHEFGMTVFGYLLECRMMTARQLLLDTSFTVEQISRIVGFTDHTAFHTAFRRRFGVTPMQYRNIESHRYR